MSRRRSWYPPAHQADQHDNNEEEVVPTADADPMQSTGADDQGESVGSLAEREEGVMVQRLEVWVQRRLASLPKSKSTLLRALRTDLCSLRRQVYTPDAALARLVREGFIELCASDTNASEHPQRERSTPPSPPPPAAPAARRSEVAFHALPAADGGCGDGDGAERDEAKETAMRKMRRWVEQLEAHPKTRPATVEATKRVLGQLCRIDVGFRPERLLELLEAKHYLRLNEDDDAVVWLLDEREAEAKRKDRHRDLQQEEDKRQQEGDKQGKRKAKKKRL